MSRQASGWFKVARVFAGVLIFATANGASAAGASGDADSAAAKAATRAAQHVSAESCAMLDDPKLANRMDGLLFFLAKGCGRQADFIGQVESEMPFGALPYLEPVTDVNVSNPAGDTGTTRTQSETSIERNPITGTLCSAYNDSYHGVTQSQGFSGFSRSTDGGATWVDKGAVSSEDSGDPSLVWRRLDGKFYYAALLNGGLGLYRSDDDCLSFTLVSQVATGNDDKEIMAIDNEPTSPFYGRIYIVWTDFGANARIYSTYSANAGSTWSTQLAISADGVDVQGAWPTIAPNGDIYVTWLTWLTPGYPSGNLEVPIYRSTNGGVSYTALTPAMTNKINPRDAAATSSCGRPAIKGNVRLLPSPQIVFRNGYLHSVYAYDPDAFGTGDVINVYYRRYNPSTSTWGSEVLINDDATLTDQYQPTISVGTAGQVTVGYYSRQLDTVNNLLVDYYSRTSFDNGANWNQASVRLSDASSSIVLDGSLATCYHGDYDQQLQDGNGRAHYLWSDDRAGTPDVFTDRTLVGTDYLLVPVESSVAVCAPDDADYMLNVNQFQGFSEPVTLSSSGNPAGSTVVFGANPVTPPNSTTVTITTSGVAAGDSVIDIVGTSSPSAIVQNTALGLSVFTVVPNAPTLVSPANNEPIAPVRPTFVWSAATQAANYILEVDDEPSFAGPLVYTATVAGTSHTPNIDFPSSSTLYWRVRSDNICGVGPDATAFQFTTVPLPGDCPLGSFTNALYSTDFEGDNSAWTLGAGSTGSSNWLVSTARPNSAAKSWLGVDLASISDQRLVSPSIALPNSLNLLNLQFQHWRDLEVNGAAGCYDGGLLEIAINGGAFTQIPNSQILEGPYTGPVSTSFQSPIGGLQAWCGAAVPYSRVVVDLSSYAGQNAQFRFRLGSDSSVGKEGWYVDDVRVQGCSVSDVIYVDGFDPPPG